MLEVDACVFCVSYRLQRWVAGEGEEVRGAAEKGVAARALPACGDRVKVQRGRGGEIGLGWKGEEEVR